MHPTADGPLQRDLLCNCHNARWLGMKKGSALSMLKPRSCQQLQLRSHLQAIPQPPSCWSWESQPGGSHWNLTQVLGTTHSKSDSWNHCLDQDTIQQQWMPRQLKLELALVDSCYSSTHLHICGHDAQSRQTTLVPVPARHGTHERDQAIPWENPKSKTDSHMAMAATTFETEMSHLQTPCLEDVWESTGLS